MSKAPLKQLSVNTFERHRIVSEKKVKNDLSSTKKKKAVSKQLIPVEETSNEQIESIVQTGSRMSNEEFQSLVQSETIIVEKISLFSMPFFLDLETAPDTYWRIMAEYYRTKLDDVTRENQQVNEELVVLRKRFRSFLFSYMRLLMD